jgi:hypothetical protein
MTIKEGAERAIACPTMAAALDARYISSLKDERVAASKLLSGPEAGGMPLVDKAQLIGKSPFAFFVFLSKTAPPHLHAHCPNLFCPLFPCPTQRTCARRCTRQRSAPTPRA